LTSTQTAKEKKVVDGGILSITGYGTNNRLSLLCLGVARRDMAPKQKPMTSFEAGVAPVEAKGKAFGCILEPAWCTVE
jgi:hypothetical protein